MFAIAGAPFVGDLGWGILWGVPIYAKKEGIDYLFVPFCTVFAPCFPVYFFRKVIAFRFISYFPSVFACFYTSSSCLLELIDWRNCTALLCFIISN